MRSRNISNIEERLVELLKPILKVNHYAPTFIAERLFDEGVIAPPLMMAEVIYMIIDNEVVKYHITKIEQESDYSFRFGAFPCENIKPFTKTKYFKENAIGKTVFQNYSEAVVTVKGKDYYE